MIRNYLTLTLILATCSLIGCKSNRLRTKPPTAQVTGVRLVEHTTTGSRLEVLLQLGNPNDFGLPLTRSDFSFRVAGGDSFTFNDQPHRSIPAKGTQLVRLPVALANPSSIVGAAFVVEGSVTYEPPGEIRKLLTESSVPLPSVGFRGEGVVTQP